MNDSDPTKDIQLPTVDTNQPLAVPQPPIVQIGGQPVTQIGAQPIGQIGGQPVTQIPLKPIASLPTSRHRGYDVHAWTSTIREVLPEVKTIIKQYQAEQVDQDTWNLLLTDIQDYYNQAEWIQSSDLARMFPAWKHLLAITLHSFKRNWQPGGYLDCQLDCINICCLVVCGWNLAKSIGQFGTRIFLETLIEVGQTCIQGHSHRLIWCLIILYRSIN